MNNLTAKIKISAVVSLIAVGVALTGCASKSRPAKGATADTTISAPASAADSTATTAASDATTASNAAASTSAQVTGGTSGQAPISHEDLTALQKLGKLVDGPSAQ